MASLCLLSTLMVNAQDYRRLIEAADSYYEKEQYHSSAQYYQVALGLRSDQAEPNYRLAHSYRAIFNYPLAAIYYEKTLDLDPVGFPLSLFYMAQMQKATGRFREALENFAVFISANQNNQILTAVERERFLAQAAIERDGCLWAIEQISKSWKQVGFINLPYPVNSEFNDYAAAVWNNDSSITITSGRKGVKGGLLDNRYGDYFTDNLRFAKNGTWQSVPGSDRFDQTNTKFSDGAGTYNSQGDKYYFTSCYEDNAYCQLYVTQMTRGQWRAPKLLNSNINAPGYDNRHPALTPGGDTLIFVSNRPGGKGANDLWFSVNGGEDDWQPPRLVPGNINTPFNEASPFYHPEGVLFFSSDGHIGIGGLDIFMCPLWPDSTAEIKNLGIPFNSGYDDNFASMGSFRGYLSSNRAGGTGKFDIYSFNIPQERESIVAFFNDPGIQEDQLSSRIRNYDNSNLFAARDEDQFYYDNLSAEERAHFDRILAAKQSSDGGFDPESLTPDDFRYYKKLDIGTKAVIERMAQRKARELQVASDTPGIVDISGDPLETSDLAFYENVSDEERAIIDRIIRAKIDDRQNLVAEFDPGEKNYWYSNENGSQERIEAKAQIRSIDSVIQDIEETRIQTEERFKANEENLLSQTGFENTDDLTNIRNQLVSGYIQSIEDLEVSHKLFYRELTPSQRDDLHRLALRQAILGFGGLSATEKQRILNEFQLTEAVELAIDEAPFSAVQKVMANEIAETLQQHFPLAANETWPADYRQSFNGLDTRQRVALALNAHQQLLQVQLDQDLNNKSELRQHQQQLSEVTAKDPDLTPQRQSTEERIAEKISEKYLSFIPRMLSPREAYYFRGLTPGHQLRLDRLSRVIQVPVANDEKLPSQPIDYLLLVPGEDADYFKGLTPSMQKTLQEIVLLGKDGSLTYNEEQNDFMQRLDPEARERVQRLIRAQEQLTAGLVPATSSKEPIQVSGQLRDAASQRSAANVEVALMNGQGELIAVAITDTNGNFQFREIDPQPDLWVRPHNEDLSQTSLYTINEIKANPSSQPLSHANSLPGDQRPVADDPQDLVPDESLVVGDVLKVYPEEERRQILTTLSRSQASAMRTVPAIIATATVGITGFVNDKGTGRSSPGILVALVNSQGQIMALDSTDHNGQFLFYQTGPQPALRVLPLNAVTGTSPYMIGSISILPDERKAPIEEEVVNNFPSDSLTTDAEVELPAETTDTPRQNEIPADQFNSQSQGEEYQGPFIYFDFDRYSLRTEAKQTLLELATYLNEQPAKVRVFIDGHTDHLGPDSYNKILSEKRSSSTSEYLTSLSSKVLTTIRGFGEAQPLVSNSTAYGRQFNRRVEIKLQGPGPAYFPTMKTFLIKPGVRLNILAAAAGVSEELLMQWNGLTERTLRPYQPLRLPANIDFTTIAPLVFDPLGREIDPANVRFHLVKYGETLFRLAKLYGTTVQTLELLNDIDARDLKAGQRLRVR